MSVWSNPVPGGAALSGHEGTLVCVSIDVDPRGLESLLEALAQVGFPINPEIYHDAALVYVDAGGGEDRRSVTLVEFPAYERRLAEVRAALEAHGFDPARVQVMGMLDAIHSGSVPEPLPPGSAYVSRYRVRKRAAAA